MPSEDQVKINIKFTKEGEAARQAKAEIEDLKNSSDKSSGSVKALGSRISGLSMLLHGMSSVMSGAANGVRGLGAAVGGLFQLVITHPVGRLIAIFISLGALVVQLSTKFQWLMRILKEVGMIISYLWNQFLNLLGIIPKNSTEAKRLAENMQELNKTDLTFDAARKGLAELSKSYQDASSKAKALQSAQDELADAQLATRLAGLDLEEEKALASAGPDEAKRKAIQFDFAQQKLAVRYERESEKAKSDQSERSRAYYAAANEKERLERQLPELEAQKENYRERLREMFENPKVLAATDAETVRANKQGFQEFKQIVNETRERLAALNAEIQTAQLAEKAALEKRRALDLEYQTATKRTTRSYAEEADAIRIQRDKEFSEGVANLEKEDVAAAKSAADPRVNLALQRQRAEEQSAKIRLSAAQKAAGAKGQSKKQQQASAASLQSAQASYYQESADVAAAASYAEQIRAAVDPAELDRLLSALEAIGTNVNQMLSQTTAKANQVASQIKNGGMRTQ